MGTSDRFCSTALIYIEIPLLQLVVQVDVSNIDMTYTLLGVYLAEEDCFSQSSTSPYMLLNGVSTHRAEAVLSVSDCAYGTAVSCPP